MAKNLTILWPIFLACGVLDCAAATRKRPLSIGEARRELGVVAAYQQFPEKYRIDRFNTLEADGVYYHVFLSHLPRRNRWRTLVFANSGDYLGYYETADPPVETEKDALIYPGASGSSLNGDFVEGDSSQPSVYYHLQDSAYILAGSGYKPLFSNLYVWKKERAEIMPAYSPVRGEFIQQRSVLQKADPPR